MGIWYATREDVQLALDAKSTARDNAQIDRLIESESRGLERFLHRKFAPVLATRYFDWPNAQMGRSYRLWLDQYEAISLTSVMSGGKTIAPADYFLEPANEGPPYDRLEINLSGQAAFDVGATHQRDIALAGLFGHSDDPCVAGALNGAIDAVQTSLIVTDGSLVGVGSVLKIGTERATVTGRAAATTAQTLQTPVGATNAEVTLAVTTGAAYHVGEVVLLDAERMLIVDVAGNNLIVKRAWDGSVLAAHAGATIYAYRSLTVVRGQLGTTAAVHADTSAVTCWMVPGPVRRLCIGEVLNSFEQEKSGYARTIGATDNVRNASGGGIEDLRKSVFRSHGRKARLAVV